MPEYKDVEVPIELEMIERMPKSLRSGTFIIGDDLIKLTGSLGAVIQAVIERANRVDASIEIHVEKERMNHFARAEAVQTFNRVTVEWTR